MTNKHSRIIVVMLWTNCDKITKCFYKFKISIYENGFFVYNKSGNKKRSEERRMIAQWKSKLNVLTEVSGAYFSFFSVSSLCFDDYELCFPSR